MANLDLSKYGITGVKKIYHNPSYEELFKAETDPSLQGYEKGQVTELGAVNVMTGIYTGRSPKDKFFVLDDTTRDTIWWTSEGYKNDNKPVSPKTWDVLKELAVKELSNKDLYVMDTFCGANENSRIKVRFIMEVAWQAHFVKNMFIRPTEEELANYGEPDFVSFNAAKAKVVNYKELGLNSETAVVFNLTEKQQVILNTWYGGEMKKGIFSYMNYPPEATIRIDTAWRYALPEPETAEKERIVNTALATLPDTRMSAMNVRIAELSLSSAKAMLFPSLSASAGIGSSYYKNLKQDADAFATQFKNNLSKSVSASLSVPIFGGWSRQSNLARTRNELRSSEQTLIETRRQIAVEVEQAVLDLNGAYFERQQAEKQVQAQLLAYRVAQRKYQEGLLSVLDLQTTANQLLQARATLLSAELTWQAKRKLVDYYKGVPFLSE